MGGGRSGTPSLRTDPAAPVPPSPPGRSQSPWSFQCAADGGCGFPPQLAAHNPPSRRASDGPRAASPNTFPEQRARRRRRLAGPARRGRSAASRAALPAPAPHRGRRSYSPPGGMSHERSAGQRGMLRGARRHCPSGTSALTRPQGHFLGTPFGSRRPAASGRAAWRRAGRGYYFCYEY